MFNIKEFKAYLNNTGTLPTNRFFVEIPVPRVLLNSEVVVNNTRRPQVQFTQDLQFRAESVRTPGVTLLFDQVNRYGIGPTQKFPHNANFTDTSISFIADKDSLVWIFFYNWLNNIFSYTGYDYMSNDDASALRYRANYMSDYAVSVYIHVYDYDGKPSTNVELIDAYPVSINDVNLAWDTTNTLMRVTVTFAFRHWRLTNVNTSDASIKAPAPPNSNVPKQAQTVQSITLPTAFTAGPNQLGSFNNMNTRDQKGVGIVMGIQGTAGF